MKKFKNRRHRPYAPWITDNIKLLQRLRKRALQAFRETRNPGAYEYYKQLRNFTTHAVRCEKKAYMAHKFKECSAAGAWAELRRLNVIRKKQHIIPSNLNNVNEMNKHFVGASAKYCSPKPETVHFYEHNILPHIDGHFNFKLVGEMEIIEAILGIKSKAFSVDQLNSTLIQLCCPQIVPYITHIINECLLTSYFPDLWKRALVSPVPKVTNPTDMNQLRSINVLPTFSKILERIMASQINEYLQLNNILPQNQSGFRKRYSCETTTANVFR